jgi:tetratricopeptide (TPR) repeat protein
MVKVIDFGLAKALDQQLTDKTLFTGQAQIIGTPLYMSPEQAGLTGLDVDTRSDIYSLGVLLYELLTGTTPLDWGRFRGAGYDEIRRIIREEEPPPPSQRLRTTPELRAVAANRGLEPRRLSGLLRGELDWVVMKCLEKDRNRRYETISALAADVQYYLHDEPVQAGPPSVWHRYRKFARRHRTALAVAGLVLLFIALVGGGVGWAVRDRAAREARTTNELEQALESGDRFLGEGKRAEARAVLDRADLLAGQVPADPARDARLAALKERLAAAERDQDFSDLFQKIRLRVQSQISEAQGRFAEAAAFPKIRDALQQYGITIGDMAPARVATLVQGRPEPVSRDLVAALDECLRWAPEGDETIRQWLLDALAAADTNAGRAQARQAAKRRDWNTLEQWGRTVDVREQPPSFLVLVARSLPAPMMSARLELLRRTQRAHPTDLWANYWLAFLLLETGRAAEAIRYYTAALALQPDSPGLYVDRGRALSAAGELDLAIADYHQALALAPDYALAHNNLGNALYRKGQLDNAIACYRNAIHFKPVLPQAHNNLGSALADKGWLEEAIAACREAIRLKKDFPEAHYNLGNILYRKGQVDDAIAAYRQAIGLKKDYARAHYNLGYALADKNQLDEAIAAYRQAIRLKPDYAQAHYYLGNALDRKGQLEDAIAAYREAVRLKPDYAQAHYYLGNALDRRGQLEDAIAAYGAAIHFKQDYPEAHGSLGYALYRKGRVDEAIAACRQAIRLKKDFAHPHFILADALRLQGEFRQAVAALRRCLELLPEGAPLSKDVRRKLGLCEHLLALDTKLPAVLAGQEKPTNAAEQQGLDRLCQHFKKRYAAARFYAAAFAAQPQLADHLGAADRYDAACCAALAGCGQGTDAAELDGEQRGRLRRQGLDWLRADLEAWRRLLNPGLDQVRPVVAAKMRHWLANPDFEGVRGSQTLAKLPEAERQAWQNLWAAVADMLARAQDKTTPQEKSDVK